MRFLVLIFKNVRRNLVRTLLTSLGTMVLVFVVTLVWSILAFLNAVTDSKSQNFKVIVSERWKIPSVLPYSYANTLVEGAYRNEGDVRPMDHMTWQFYGGTLDPEKTTRDAMLFGIGIEPKKIRSMMDELDELPPERAVDLEATIKKMEANRQGVIIGHERLAQINKRVGDRFTVTGMTYKGINLEFEVVGVFPEGRYNNSLLFNRDYLNAALDAWPAAHNNQKHPMDGRSLNLVWLKVPDEETFNKLDKQIETSPLYTTPAVKCETASSAVSAFLAGYRDLIWGMRWLLAPAVLLTLSLVISNAISIGVRERRTELAVLKVLGFRPFQILFLVLGEAILIGATSGLLSASLAYFIINSPPPFGFGGLKFPIAFFSAFMIPVDAFWWGLAVGLGTAFLGSIVPALSARNVKVSEVFAKVA